MIQFDDQTGSSTISPAVNGQRTSQEDIQPAAASTSLYTDIARPDIEDDQTTFRSARSRFSSRSLLTRSSLFSASTGFHPLNGATWRHELIIDMQSGFGPGAPRNRDYRPVQEGRERGLRGGFLPRIRGVGRIGKGPILVPKAMVDALDAEKREIREAEVKAKAIVDALNAELRAIREAEAKAKAKDEARRQEIKWREEYEESGRRRLAEMVEIRLEQKLREEAEAKETRERKEEMEVMATRIDKTSGQQDHSLEDLGYSYAEAWERIVLSKRLIEWFSSQLIKSEKELWKDHNTYSHNISDALKTLSDVQQRSDHLWWEVALSYAKLRIGDVAREWNTDCWPELP